ncbi:MAG: hypothetical protein EHM64_17230 [Ignavibacteriae bacterium]|nr:MAG: hypothetical protein EHM64_17230 [Ignavibacteriota bacterium]
MKTESTNSIDPVVLAQKYLNDNINEINNFTLDTHAITISFKNGSSIEVCADEFELFFINLD